MNIDQLPFAAFALQSAAGRDRPGGRSNTLTLRLVRPALLGSYGLPMSGSVEIDTSGRHCESLLRAAVLPADGLGLTITF